jgi:hypothetical protein
MKVIRPLNHEQHPSIVSFNCFIITPSYAIIAMSVAPTIPLARHSFLFKGISANVNAS